MPLHPTLRHLHACAAGLQRSSPPFRFAFVVSADAGAREFVDLGVDAQINLARGVIVTKTTAPVTDGKEFFGPASFHENDYSFFYKNLQENVAKRIAAYKNNN